MTPGESLLQIKGISKRFASMPVLEDIKLEIAESEFITVLGESGSGKTTLIRIIAGFERPDTGELWMRGERLDLLPPHRRPVNTVFQHYALFPHLSAFENVAYGLRARKIAPTEIRSRVEVILAQMRMDQFSSRKPSQLSGGQQQRVALARALVNRPSLLLLDEPLSALDASLRRQMQLELKALQQEVGITFLFVTHDQEEAMALSDRIVLLRNGRIEQVDAARDIYNRPRTAYVAAFIGHTNLLRAQVKNGMARSGGLEWPYAGQAGNILFSLRPEHIRIVNGNESPTPESIRARGSVRKHIFAGASELLEVDCGEGLILNVRVPNQGGQFQDVTLEVPHHRLIPLADGNN